MHAPHHGAVAVRCRAPVPSQPLTPLHDPPCDLKFDFELRMLQERVKYAMLGGSEVVVGTSIASYVFMHAHHGAVAVRCRAPAPT